jgi:hypothetical protein
METKKWYMSKTIRTNALFLLAVIIQILTNTQMFDPDIQIAIVAAANVVLRFVTAAKVE